MLTFYVHRFLKFESLAVAGLHEILWLIVLQANKYLLSFDEEKEAKAR